MVNMIMTEFQILLKEILVDMKELNKILEDGLEA